MVTKKKSLEVSRGNYILTINGGSSSIRFAVFETGVKMLPRLDGKLDRIGLRGGKLIVNSSEQKLRTSENLSVPNANSAISFIVSWLEDHGVLDSVKAVGHRIVHGMEHSDPERITPKLLDDLREIIQYDPEHLPAEIEFIEAIGKRYPKVPQVACFDTAFHRTMPRNATLLAIPRRFDAKGIRRYGFHGLSYEYLVSELARLGDPTATKGRLILAHLGNGASLTAVRDGKSIDTSMGFTPSSGIMMGTRSGDLDPGLMSYLSRNERMSPARFQKMVTSESGLLGVSDLSSDMQSLLEQEGNDVRASEAVELFCYQAKKWIGAFTAALGGVDAIIFTGGIGENAPVVRERICNGLGYLGIELNRKRNAMGAPTISRSNGRVKVRVIRTDEEQMIARSVCRILSLGKESN